MTNCSQRLAIIYLHTSINILNSDLRLLSVINSNSYLSVFSLIASVGPIYANKILVSALRMHNCNLN